MMQMILRIVNTGLLGLAFLLSGPVMADPPTPYASFQAKRVKPPAPGTTNRITVQIDPTLTPQPAPKSSAGDVTDPDAAPDSAGTAPASPGRYAWFWEKVSPELGSTGPGRLYDALQVLNGSGKVTAPRLQALQDIARVRGVPILRSTIGTNVSPALVLAVISVESAGKADAVSGAGATGLMQLMPATASRFGVSDSLVAEDNIAGGVKYLDWLMREFDNDPILVLAGYNAGEGNVRNHKGVPPFAETRDYVPKVLAAFQVARGLCTTPPELVTDGCVFAAMN